MKPKILFFIVITFMILVISPVNGEITVSPDSTQPVVSPTFTVIPVQYDSELRYDTGLIPPLYHDYSPGGFAVFFSNKDDIFIKGIRLFGCRYGDVLDNVTIEIWDKNLTKLYRYSIPYEKIPFNKLDESQRSEVFFNKIATWVNIGIPEFKVSNDFFIVIFTHSDEGYDDEYGIFIGFEIQEGNFTSHIVHSNPNRIETEGGPAGNKQYDWRIRVLYSKQPTITPNPTSNPSFPVAIVPTTTVTTNAFPTISTWTSPTKAGSDFPIILFLILLSIYLIRRIT